jgi:hypothetical protein
MHMYRLSANAHLLRLEPFNNWMPCSMGSLSLSGLALLLLVTLTCHAASAQLTIPSDTDYIPLRVRPSRGSVPGAPITTEHESGILLPRARSRPSGNTTRGCPLTAYKVLRNAPRAAAALEDRCE